MSKDCVNQLSGSSIKKEKTFTKSNMDFKRQASDKKSRKEKWTAAELKAAISENAIIDFADIFCQHSIQEVSSLSEDEDGDGDGVICIFDFTAQSIKSDIRFGKP